MFLDYLCLISFIFITVTSLVSPTKFTAHPMKYEYLPVFIPLLAAIYLMAVYGLLKIAENQRRLKSGASNTKDPQQLEVNS